MRDWFRKYYRSQQFNPDWIGLFVNPFYLARRALWRQIAAVAATLQGPLLDVGCGTRPYESLFRVESYFGLDVASETTRRLAVADAFYDGRTFPFKDQAFGSVLCNQVLEHVFNPDEFVGELHRVLRRGGTLLLTVPFVWDEHEQPHDYARYSSFGLADLLQRHGFRIVLQRKLLADCSVIFQLFGAYLFKVTRSRFQLWNLTVSTLLLAPLSVLGLVLGKLLPDNPDLFLDQLVIAERLP